MAGLLGRDLFFLLRGLDRGRFSVLAARSVLDESHVYNLVARPSPLLWNPDDLPGLHLAQTETNSAADPTTG